MNWRWHYQFGIFCQIDAHPIIDRCSNVNFMVSPAFTEIRFFLFSLLENYFLAEISPTKSFYCMQFFKGLRLSVQLVFTSRNPRNPQYTYQYGVVCRPIFTALAIQFAIHFWREHSSLRKVKITNCSINLSVRLKTFIHGKNPIFEGGESTDEQQQQQRTAWRYSDKDTLEWPELGPIYTYTMMPGKHQTPYDKLNLR